MGGWVDAADGESAKVNFFFEKFLEIECMRLGGYCLDAAYQACKSTMIVS